MVGVVEQQGEGGAALAERADRGDQGGVVPLVHDHHVRAVGQRLDVRLRAVGGPAQVGEGGAERRQAVLAMVGGEVGRAPAVPGLAGDHVPVALRHLAQHAAQEVGVAVVPAAPQGVGEIDQPHVQLLPS